MRTFGPRVRIDDYLHVIGVYGPEEILRRIMARSPEAPDGCRYFQGALATQRGKIVPSSHGYVQLYRGGGGRGGRSHFYTSVLVYLCGGGTLNPGEVVRHTCDHGSCNNRDHLIPGTQLENIQDSIRGGTHVSVVNKKLWASNADLLGAIGVVENAGGIE
jgi:hypothetical protein